MGIKLPVVKKCCFCFSLRIGSLIIGYITAIVSIIVITSIIIYMSLVSDYLDNYIESEQITNTAVVIMWVSIVTQALLSIIYGGIAVVLVIGTHKSIHSYLRFTWKAWLIFTCFNVVMIAISMSFNGSVMQFIALLNCGVSAGGGGWEPLGQPYFDNSTRREATAAVGQPAYLHCRVRNLADRAVSWIRKRDLHILTVGVHTYSSDARFAALHADGSDEWTLRVAPAQPRDSGAYECQVSTEPKISLSFRLTVVVSKAEILAGPELFVRAGSDINLTCIARHAPDPPSFIYWYRGTHVVNYAQRGGISVETEQRTRTSRLLIARASPHDSGNYTCAPSSSDSASVVVHVLSGERPAAMQSSGALVLPRLSAALLATTSAIRARFSNDLHLNIIIVLINFFLSTNYLTLVIFVPYIVDIVKMATEWNGMR